MIYICEKWVSRHRKYRVYFELRLIDGKKCEARGPTAIGLPFSIPIYMGNRPSPMVPDCGAYAIRLYPAGRLFSSKWVGAQQHTSHQTSPLRGRMRVPGYFAGAFVWGARALFFICHGVGASPHRPPLPFLVLTQEKAPAGAGKFAWYIQRNRARDEIRKTCVATLRFGHSDFRARPCNSSFRALGNLCRSPDS